MSCSTTRGLLARADTLVPLEFGQPHHAYFKLHCQFMMICSMSRKQRRQVVGSLSLPFLSTWCPSTRRSNRGPRPEADTKKGLPVCFPTSQCRKIYWALAAWKHQNIVNGEWNHYAHSNTRTATVLTWSAWWENLPQLLLFWSGMNLVGQNNRTTCQCSLGQKHPTMII